MRTKKLLSLILTLCIVLTTIGSLSIAASAAEVTTYQFYTLVGDEFIPNTNAATEGVTWNNTTVDTSVMGRRIITGKDGSGNDVKGIVNVGYKKWLSYDNNESYTVGDGVPYGSTYTNRWRLASSSYVDFAFYAQDPFSSENTVIKYNGADKFLDYVLPNPISTGNSFSVEMKLMLSNIENSYCTQLQMRKADDSAWGPTILIRYSTSAKKLYIYESGSSSNVAYLDTQNKEWMDLKFVAEGTTMKIYEGGSLLVTATISSVCGLKYLRLKNVVDAVGDTYIDDVKVTDLTATTDRIYYGDAVVSRENSNSFIKKAGSTEKLSASATFPLVNENGVASGYTALLYNSINADISELGTYSDSVSLPGFDEKINFNWTVYEKRNAWVETFEGYTEADLGNAPHIEPWEGSSATSGNALTVEYEDANAENTILKYNTTVVEPSYFAKFTNNKNVSGKYSVSFKVKVPKIYSKDNGLTLQICGNGKVLIEPNISFDTSGGYITCRSYTNYDSNGAASDSGTGVLLVDKGKLVANEWYTVTFNLDTESDTFTYECVGTNANTSNQSYGVRNKGNNPFSYVCFANRQHTEDQTYYLDDIFVTKQLTIKEPVSQEYTVYKGDSIEALPERATVLLTDNETYDTAPVVWSAASLDTNTVGVKSVTGTVKGTDKKATVTVNVSAFPYEIVMPSLKSDGKEVCGLIKGGSIDAAYIKKISNDTLAGKVYAALYDENMKLLGADVATINTINTWNKDDSKDIEMLLGIPNSADIDIDNCTLKLFTFSDSLVPFAELKVHKNADIEQSATTIYIAGDSTASIKKDSLRPEMGWGEAFATLCSGTGITVDNRAVDGQSSKSFYDNGMLNNILNDAEKGDYIFINLGSNDAPGKGEERETNPTEGGTYEEYLTKYITEARAKGVIPVILTSMIRARWTTANDISNAGPKFIGDTLADLDKYAAAAKRIAAKYHVPMIDLHAITTEFVLSKTSNQEAWTDEEKAEVWKYFDYYKDADAETLVEGNKDTSHLNAKGAEFVANAIVDELKAILHPLGTLFN